MRWTEIDTDPEGERFPAAAAAATGNLDVELSLSAWQRLLDHVSASRVEEGGILLGTVEVRPVAGERSGLLVVVREAIPAERRASNAVHFSFVPGTWEDVLQERRALSQNLRIVGWYHFHPGLGAFFSSTDRTTQRSCFRQPWHVGLVVDPIRDEMACFVGPGSQAAASCNVRPASCTPPAWPQRSDRPERRENASRILRVCAHPAVRSADGTRCVLAGLVGPAFAGRGRRAARLRQKAMLVLRARLLRPSACVLRPADAATAERASEERPVPLPLDRIVRPPLGARTQRRLPAPGPTALGWQSEQAKPS